MYVISEDDADWVDGERERSERSRYWMHQPAAEAVGEPDGKNAQPDLDQYDGRSTLPEHVIDDGKKRRITGCAFQTEIKPLRRRAGKKSGAKVCRERDVFVGVRGQES